MTILVEMPLKKYPRNIITFIRVANVALTMRLMRIMATVGLESWQRHFSDSKHFAKGAIILITELELTGGERRGWVSEESTELMDTFAGSIAAVDPSPSRCTPT